MNQGSQQQPSFNTGSSSGQGWQQPFSTQNTSQYSSSPFFNMSVGAPQIPTQMGRPSWQTMSPSFNYFAQSAAQGNQTNPLANQAGINNALAAPPSSTPPVQQNFTLADANVTAGLPATGMPQPVPVPSPTPTPAPPPVPATPTNITLSKAQYADLRGYAGGKQGYYPGSFTNNQWTLTPQEYAQLYGDAERNAGYSKLVGFQRPI